MRSRRLLAALGRPVSLGRPADGAQPFSAQAAPKQEDLVPVFVDGKQVNVPKGASVLQACDAAGIDIPRCAPSPCT